MFNKVSIFGRLITAVPQGDLSLVLSQLLNSKPVTVYFCNVHMLMLSQQDSLLAQAMDAADIVFPDGVPVAWLQRRIQQKDCRVVRGYEVLLVVCQQAARDGKRVGFLGSTGSVLDALVVNMVKSYPDLNVAFVSTPPFASGELISSTAEIDFINEARLDWLFVGLGCPKQEKWIHRYAPQLECSVLAVGAAFDWLAGSTTKPPDWMEKTGLGWLYRLIQNPRRMWRRYLIYNSMFIFNSAKLLTRYKLASMRKGKTPK